ncbi:MAG TPA: hypothetical protein VK806_10595 [Bacteroidia bacterium]|jgi:hypothetical protein|nr:hypothetical protein [Bacteroidia bacterium]
MLQVHPVRTEKELNEDILRITLLIQDKYPELSKFIGEMPVTVPNANDTESTIKNLESYYHSLNSLLSNYNTSHAEGLKLNV